MKCDKIVELLRDENNAIFESTRRAAREGGLLVGISAASILYMALRKAKEFGRGKSIVAVIPDS